MGGFRSVRFRMRQLETGRWPHGQDWSKHADTLWHMSVFDLGGRDLRCSRRWQLGPPGTSVMNCSFEDAGRNAPPPPSGELSFRSGGVVAFQRPPFRLSQRCPI